MFYSYKVIICIFLVGVVFFKSIVIYVVVMEYELDSGDSVCKMMLCEIVYGIVFFYFIFEVLIVLVDRVGIFGWLFYIREFGGVSYY